MLETLYAVVGTTAVALALVSRTIRRAPVSEALLALLLGVAVGPVALGWVELSPAVRDVVLLELARVLLAASVMTAALRFPVAQLRSVLRPVVLLVAVVMPVAALAGTAAALVAGLPVALALVVGAALCPTDPVLAASVVSGGAAQRDLPARLRRVLTAESGANDGLALPLVAVAVAVATPRDASWGAIAWDVLGAAGVGIASGLVAARAVRVATRERSLERGPELVLTLLLAVAVLGLARVAGTGGVLAVFVAGLAYNRHVAEGERVPQKDLDEAVNRYAVLPLFTILGAALPWADWAALGWGGVGLVAVVLLVRRPPWVLLAARGLGLRLREAAFVGWFGPMGVSSVFYLAHAADRAVADPRVFAAGSLAVAASVVAFGVTATPARVAFARRSGR